MARYVILSQRYSPSLERHSMEPPPSQMTVLGWTDVAAIGLSRCGDSSGDENMARYAILSQRYSPSLERHSMEPPPSQMTVLGWTDVAAIAF